MGELERMLELFPEKEAPNINTAFRKLHANLKFRSEVAAVSISAGPKALHHQRRAALQFGYRW